MEVPIGIPFLFSRSSISCSLRFFSMFICAKNTSSGVSGLTSFCGEIFSLPIYLSSLKKHLACKEVIGYNILVVDE